MNRFKEIRELKCRADKFQLENREIVGKYPIAKLASIYNGIGPGAFPDWLRDVITELHPSLAVVAFIHDVEWYESDRSKEKFAESNNRFKTNGYKVARAEYGWYNPLRYIVMNQARRFGELCQLFGWDGWCSVRMPSAAGGQANSNQEREVNHKEIDHDRSGDDCRPHEERQKNTGEKKAK